MKQKTVRYSDKPTRHPGTYSGQSIIEFALVVPILAVILIGVLDLGRMYYAYIEVVNASREGARWGAEHPPKNCPASSQSNPTDRIIYHTRYEAEYTWINTGQLDVFVSCPDGNTEFGNKVKVEVRYPFQMITSSLLGAGPITLRSATQMQIFGRDPL